MARPGGPKLFNDLAAGISAGLGFGSMHTVMMYGALLGSAAGEAAWYLDTCPAINAYVLTAVVALLTNALHVTLMIIAIDAQRRASWRWVSLPVAAHLLFSLIALLNGAHNGCVAELPLQAGVLLATLLVCGRLVRSPNYTAKRQQRAWEVLSAAGPDRRRAGGQGSAPASAASRASAGPAAGGGGGSGTAGGTGVSSGSGSGTATAAGMRSRAGWASSSGKGLSPAPATSTPASSGALTPTAAAAGPAATAHGDAQGQVTQALAALGAAAAANTTPRLSSNVAGSGILSARAAGSTRPASDGGGLVPTAMVPPGSAQEWAPGPASARSPGSTTSSGHGRQLSR
jgi:hypothetical protein